MAKSKELKDFLSSYLGQGEEKKDIVTQNAIDDLLFIAEQEGIEQEIIDYGTKNPEAPFWDFLDLIPLDTGGEEIVIDDDDD